MAVYARGPWSHLVGGTIEQNVIFHVVLAAMNGGELVVPAGQTIEDADVTPQGTDEAREADAGEEGTAQDAVEEGAENAIVNLPDDATAEPLEDAAEAGEPTDEPKGN